MLRFASEALENGDSVIIDRSNFNAEQRRTWTKLAEEIQLKLRSIEEEAVKCKFSEADSMKRIFKLCLVLPKWDDVRFCSDRAFSRGDDDVHKAGTDWLKICRIMKKDFVMPSLKEEAFDALHICFDEEDLNRTICSLATDKS